MQDAPPATEQAEDEAAAAKKAADDEVGHVFSRDWTAKKEAEEEANGKEEAKSKAAEEARRQVRSNDAMRRDRSQLPSSFVPFGIKVRIVVVFANQVLL